MLGRAATGGRADTVALASAPAVVEVAELTLSERAGRSKTSYVGLPSSATVGNVEVGDGVVGVAGADALGEVTEPLRAAGTGGGAAARTAVASVGAGAATTAGVAAAGAGAASTAGVMGAEAVAAVVV